MLVYPNAKINIGLNIVEKRPMAITTLKLFSTLSG